MWIEPEDRPVVKKKYVAFCYSVECMMRSKRGQKNADPRNYSKVIKAVPFGRSMCPDCKHALVWGTEDEIDRMKCRKAIKD